MAAQISYQPLSFRLTMSRFTVRLLTCQCTTLSLTVHRSPCATRASSHSRRSYSGRLTALLNLEKLVACSHAFPLASIGIDPTDVAAVAGDDRTAGQRARPGTPQGAGICLQQRNGRCGGCRQRASGKCSSDYCLPASGPARSSCRGLCQPSSRRRTDRGA